MNRVVRVAVALLAVLGPCGPARSEGPGVRELAALPSAAFDWLLDARGGAVVSHGWAVRAVTALDLGSGAARRVEAKVPGDGYGRAVSPSGRFLATATTAPGVEVVDLAAGTRVATYSVRTRNDVGDVAAALAVTDDGRVFTWQGLAPGASGEVRSWAIDGTRGPTVALGVGERVEALALSPDAARVYVATRAPDGAGGLLLVDAARAALLRRHRLPSIAAGATGQSTGLAVAGDGARVVASAVDGASGVRSHYVIDAASLAEEHGSGFAVPLPSDFLGVAGVVVSGDGQRTAAVLPGRVHAADAADASQWLRGAASRAGTLLVVDLAAAVAAAAENPAAPSYERALTRVGRVSPLGVAFAPKGSGVRVLFASRVLAVDG